MHPSDEAEDTRYRVVRNDEEQYSIWFADRALPPGWCDEGTAGSRQQCLDHIEAVWTDLRPRSLRERLAALEISAQQERAG